MLSPANGVDATSWEWQLCLQLPGTQYKETNTPLCWIAWPSNWEEQDVISIFNYAAQFINLLSHCGSELQMKIITKGRFLDLLVNW